MSVERIKTQFDCSTIVLRDGSDTPITFTLPMDSGDFQADNLTAQRTREVVLSRGELVVRCPPMRKTLVAAEIGRVATGVG